MDFINGQQNSPVADLCLWFQHQWRRKQEQKLMKKTLDQRVEVNVTKNITTYCYPNIWILEFSLSFSSNSMFPSV